MPADEDRAPGPPGRARHARRQWFPESRFEQLRWAFRWLIIPFGTAGILIAGAAEIGPALAAAEGHGTIGYFVAETEHCNKDGCGWTGDFVTLRDQVTRLNVDFNGPHGAFYKGDTLPAIDAGGPGEVFARHGSRTWAGDLAAIISGAIGFGLWTWRVPYRIARRRRRRDTFLIPGT